MAASLPLLPVSLVSNHFSASFCIVGIQRIRVSVRPRNSSRRLIKRENYLRRKLLETLTKPYPPSHETLSLPKDLVKNTSFVEKPINPVEEDELPSLPDSVIERVEDVSHQNFEESRGDAREKEVTFQTQLADSRAIPEIKSVSVKSVVGLLLGLFVVETAVAVWIFGASDGTSEEISNRPQVSGGEIENGNGKAKKPMKWNGHLSSISDTVPSMDELKLRDKVMEIRAMAREARESERKKFNKDAIQEDGDEADDEAELATMKAAVQKEIDRRLLKIRNNLRGRSVKSISANGEMSKRQPNKPKGFQRSKTNGNATETRKRKQNGNTSLKAETNGVNNISRDSDSLHLEKVFKPLKDDEIQERPDSKAVLDEERDDVWWHKLPYVIVILLRRGSDHQGGFYSFKMSPTDDDNLISYTVAFEDRGDASNFCFLLDSFFEDLEDFRADIVPLSVEELRRETSLSSKKVIVVRKGRLQLYAGQPLRDVEKALRSLT